MRSACAFFLLVLPLFSCFGEPGSFVSGQRDLGPILVRELSVRDGVLAFRADSGGCTDAGCFEFDLAEAESITAGLPHYRLTIRRIRRDDCKAFFPDGVLIEIDLEAAVGLEGAYTLVVVNPVIQASDD